MEYIKSKIPVFITILIIIGLFTVAYHFLVVKTYTYYTQIDNTKVVKNSKTDYDYKLVSYNEKGHQKEIEFGATRKLRDKAYLKLDYMFLRGVVKWEEVQPIELPNKVKEEYNIEK